MYIPVSMICWQGCVSILCDGRSYSLAGENPMTGGASGRSSCDWRRDNALMVQYVCAFSCMTMQGCQQWGQPGPVMWGVSMVPPTHWSQVKTTHPKKCFQGSVSFSNVPVSLLNSRCSCLYDGCISISFITSAVLHTHTHEPCIPQNDVWSQNGIIKKVFQEKATQWHFPQMQYIQCPLLLLFFKTLHAKIPSD